MNEPRTLRIEGAPPRSIGTAVVFALCILACWSVPAGVIVVKLGVERDVVGSRDVLAGLAAIVLSGGVAWTWHCLRHSRTTNSVVFEPTGISVWLVRGGPSREYVWSDVVEFDDGARDYVTLLLVEGRVHVPTLDEDARSAVLQLLSEQGVRRRG